MFEISDGMGEEVKQCARIKVIGVGGGGCNAVNTMIKSGLTGVEYVVANTDIQSLNVSLAPTKVQLGAEITKGLGAGANPEVGRKAALDEYEKLSEIMESSDMVFITAGMGGGTGTGAAPVIAKLAKELGALTVGVVTKPFIFEGKKRFKQAESGISILEDNVDSLITIPNQRLLYIAGESLSLVETFKKADEVLLNAVRGISDLINNTGHINADFADVSTVMANKGLSLMGTGVCSGPDRAIKAATEAISSPLLEDISIDGATGIIINITGNDTLTMHETNEAVTLIMEAADDDAEIIFGTVIDSEMTDEIKVTVIATGLGGQERVKSPTSLERKESRPMIEREEEINYRTEIEDVETKYRPSNDIYDNLETPVNETLERANLNEGEEVPREQNFKMPVQKKKSTVEEQENVSSLVENIKQAANRYETSKKREEAPKNIDNTPVTKKRDMGSREERSPAQNSGNRGKSIAEKLGFINFNEEELDTPSFMRKDKNLDENNIQR
ncbi:cell division protein FtsZ [Bacteriovoracales bacterium]|nr:cell division protein FtsZ [Bacteriovoracales bacterium]